MSSPRTDRTPQDGRVHNYVYLHQVRSVLVYKRTKRQSVPERGRHVGDGHIFVALAVDPTPLLQSLDGSHPPGATDEVGLKKNDTLRTVVVGGFVSSEEEPEEKPDAETKVLRLRV